MPEKKPCQICGKEIPDHIRGRVCSRECYAALKNPAPKPSPPAPKSAATPIPSPAPVSASPKATPPIAATTVPLSSLQANIGRGAYRKEPQIYAGTIEAVRRRKNEQEQEIQEYGIRSPLGGMIYVTPDKIEIGEAQTQPAATPSSSPPEKLPPRP